MHVNLKSMKKTILEREIIDIHSLKFEEGKIFGDCQIGKQMKASHKKLNHLTTTCVLEQLHVNLMRPMQVESPVGKRYVFVCSNNFSRYTYSECRQRVGILCLHAPV